MRNIDIVIGLGYGDEGKGRVVDHLATPDSTVIRFNGGHQAGHTVQGEKYRHVFSSIGSGTLKGADTYISRFCTFYPPAFMNEIEALVEAGYDPVVFVDSEAMVTTPFDVELNRQEEMYMGSDASGTVGVGFGATIARHELFKIHVRDLQYQHILRQKINLIKDRFCLVSTLEEGVIEDFMRACARCVANIYIINERDFLTSRPGHLIFEGAQGVMLDMDYGFFPHVTRSNTTSKNAIEMIGKYFPLEGVHMKYVTRSYSTRHGNGPFTEAPLIIQNNENETNVPNEWQGKMRIGELSMMDLRYAVDCDQRHSSGIANSTELYMTCMDQRTEELLPSPLEIGRFLGVNDVYASFSPGPDPIIRISTKR